MTVKVREILNKITKKTDSEMTEAFIEIYRNGYSAHAVRFYRKNKNGKWTVITVDDRFKYCPHCLLSLDLSEMTYSEYSELRYSHPYPFNTLRFMNEYPL